MSTATDIHAKIILTALEIPRGSEKRDGIGNRSGMASSELETTHAFGLEVDSP